MSIERLNTLSIFMNVDFSGNEYLKIENEKKKNAQTIEGPHPVPLIHPFLRKKRKIIFF